MAEVVNNPSKSQVEIRLSEKGDLDEIVSKSAFVHLERLDKGAWFLSVGDVSVWLSSDKKITANYERYPASTTKGQPA